MDQMSIGCATPAAGDDKLDAIYKLVKKLTADREEDRVLLNALSSQGQINTQSVRTWEETLENKLVNNLTKLICSKIETSINKKLEQIAIAVETKNSSSITSTSNDQNQTEKGKSVNKNFINEALNAQLDIFEENVTHKIESINSKLDLCTQMFKDGSQKNISDKGQLTSDSSSGGQTNTSSETTPEHQNPYEKGNILNSNLQTLADNVSRASLQLRKHSEKLVKFEKIVHDSEKRLEKEVENQTEQVVKCLKIIKTDIKESSKGIETKLNELTQKINNNDGTLQSSLGRLEQKVDINHAALQSSSSLQTQFHQTLQSSSGLLTDSSNTVQSPFGLLTQCHKSLQMIQGQFGTKGSLHTMMQKQTHRIIDQVIAESHIIRDKTKNQVRNVGISQTCDMNVLKFKECISSETRQFSRLWYIKSLHTHVKSNVRFNKDRTMKVSLNYGKYPRVLGLDPVNRGDRINVTARLVKQTGQTNDWVIGTVTSTLNESLIYSNSDGWECPEGWPVATINCGEVVQRGYVNNTRVLIRFEITGIPSSTASNNRDSCSDSGSESEESAEEPATKKKKRKVQKAGARKKKLKTEPTEFEFLFLKKEKEEPTE